MISVCIATYNGEKVINRQIMSILIQLKKNDEVIITDDCSTDSTVEEIKKIKDDRIKLYVNKENMGVNKSFEHSLINAKGNLIFLSDQDDVWKENKVECIINFFNNNKDIDLVQHDAIVVDENNEIISESFFKWRKYASPNILLNFIRDTHLGCCMAFRKKVINDCVPFSVLPYHDKWLGIVGPILGHRMKYISDKLILYVRYGTCTTPMFLKRRKFSSILQERLLYLWEVLAFIIKKRIS